MHNLKKILHDYRTLFGLRFMYYILIFLSCYTHAQNQKNSSYIILSGKIDNIDTQKNGIKTILLTPPFELKGIKSKTIKLSAEGAFKDTILTGDGLYYIFDNINVVPIYLSKSNWCSIKYDVKKFRDNGLVNLRGPDTTINRYYVKKMQNQVFIDRDNVNISEKEFRIILNNIRRDQLKLLSHAKLPKKIQSSESKDINYLYLSELYYYLIQKADSFPSFTPSAISRKELKINYNNEMEYKRQPYYSKLVDLHYWKKLNLIVKDRKRTDIHYSLYQNIFRLLDSIVLCQYIKNDFIRMNASFSLKEAVDKEAAYKEFLKYYTGNDEELKKKIGAEYLSYIKLKRGATSPEFVNYKNYDGGTSSLKDFMGKYVYVDIWATWCLNCWGEIPYLKKLEEKYKNKNVVFISISLDKFENEWKQTIISKKLDGIQLLAIDSKDSFISEYAVNGIPRYIFIDPEGNIVDNNAPRPSNFGLLDKLFFSVGL